MNNPHATLKMLPSNEHHKCWDQVTIIINSSDGVLPFIRFKDRTDVLSTYEQLFALNKELTELPITITANGHDTELCFEAWQSVHNVLVQWFGNYMRVAIMEHKEECHKAELEELEDAMTSGTPVEDKEARRQAMFAAYQQCN